MTPIQATMLLSEGFLPFSRGSSTQNHQSQSLADEIGLLGLWDRESEVKVSACNAGDPGSILGSGRSLEKEVATHSSILAWRIPWTEEPGGLQSIGSQRVRQDLVTKQQQQTTTKLLSI